MAAVSENGREPVLGRERWAAHLPAGVELEPRDLLADGSLPAAWAHHFSHDPGAPAVWDAARGWRTRGDLDAQTRRLAGRLYAAGLRAGDRVVISAATSTRLVEAHVAALRMGLVVVPCNAAYQQPEVAHVARDAEPAAAIVDSPERGEWIASAVEGSVLVTEPDVDLPDGPTPELDAAEGEMPALIVYTSGTTGRPKGAVLTHHNVLAGAEAVRLAWRWTSDDRLMLCLPLFHMHGLGVGLHGTLLAGASALLLERFSVDGVLDTAAEQRATLFFGVPTMYARLSESPRLGELARLRLCVAGSAPLPAELHQRIAEDGGQRVLERYGMTETLMIVSNPYDGERRPGSVGLPLPGVELRLDRHHETDSEGEILVRGPNVFSRYWRAPEATRATFDGGWFRTGDVASLDEDGYVRIVGRTKELIITGGYNVHPREVEDVLRRHPAVRDVAVVGTPDAEWGEVVTAVLETLEPVEDAALAEHAAARLAAFKRPRRFRRVDELPRNALGKIQKQELTAG